MLTPPLGSGITALRHASVLAALAFVLATQSRVVAGFGLGELAGLALIAATIGKRPAPPLWALAALLSIVLGFLIGAIFNQISGLSSIVSGRDLLALIFSLAFSICVLTQLHDSRSAVDLLSKGLTLAIIVQAVPLMLMLFGIETNAWLTDSDEPGIPLLSRYTGFSDNPNQLGILLCGYPFTVIAGLRENRGRWSRALSIFGLVAFLPIVLLVRSNTVFSVYIICTTLWFTLWFNQWQLPKHRRSDVAMRILFTALLGALSVLLFAIYAGESVQKTDSADANGRFPLWMSAIQGIGQTYLLGAGPGPQSGDSGPFQGSEAHNQLLDFTLQGGAIALVAYCALIIGVIREVVRSRSILAACMLAAILVEQLTHYTARQPISWIYLMLVFALAKREAPARPASLQLSPSGQA